MSAGVYSITNVLTGKRYVGSSQSIEQRFHNHRKQLRGGSHHSQKLQRSWIKHGEEAFIFEVLEPVEHSELLLSSEQKWIDVFKSSGDYGYNILSTAGSHLGRKRTAECRAKMARAAKGRVLSAETRAKISTSRKGFVQTQAQRIKQSLAMRGRKLSAEHVAKIIAGNKGRVVSEETRAKIANAKRGKKASQSAKEHLSEAWKNRTVEVGNVGAQKPVVCLSSGAVFNSIQAAAAATGASCSNIGRVCRGRGKTAGGMAFQFV